MKFLADEPVNSGRQPEIDCLKAFCIVPMVLLHAYEECAEEWTGFYHVVHLLEILTGAAAFMLCMGLGMRYSLHQSPRDYARRGVGLLTAGQLLYLLRDSLPSLIAWWCKGEQVFIANALLVVQTDIMTFAGFAFLLLALFRRMQVRGGMAFGIGIVMNVAAFALSKAFRTTGNYLLDQLLGYFVVTDAESYFPLCCYFIFVALGYWLGETYPRLQDKDGLSTRVLLMLAPVTAAWYILRACVPIPGLPEFLSTEQYVLNFLPDALANCAVSVCLLALFHKLLARGGDQAPGFVSHLSRHINQYYCISYVILTPMGTLLYAARGELMPGAWLPLVYGVFVLAVCYRIIEWNERRWHFGILNLEGRRRAVVYTAVWVLTLAVIAYVYPKIEAYSTFWNDYLMG